MKSTAALLFLLLAFLMSTYSCQEKKVPIQGETEWQKSMNAQFKDASTSPLTSRDLKNFDELDFFESDSSYVVKAILERTPDSEWFNMKTTTERASQERIYGIAKFTLNDKPFQLNVYQGKENLVTPGNEDYLFLPFLDLTNGETTYGGGRYLDLRLADGDTIVIDFNKAYNPYCVYNEKYSCPIVPRVNFVNTKIEAGLKMYKVD